MPESSSAFCATCGQSLRAGEPSHAYDGEVMCDECHTALRLQDCTRCRSEMLRGDAVFLIDERVVCRACHDEMRPHCPACEASLPEPPADERSRCPVCGDEIIVHRDQTLFNSTLLTLPQHEAIERLHALARLWRRLDAKAPDMRRIEAAARRNVRSADEQFHVIVHEIVALAAPDKLGGLAHLDAFQVRCLLESIEAQLDAPSQ